MRGTLPLNDNLLLAAIAGKDATAINMVAKEEGVKASIILKQVALGRVVIMQRSGKPPLGIGEGLRTKINANIGTSGEIFDLTSEVEKAKVAEKYGADTISDLSMGGHVDLVRMRISEATAKPLTTLPIYQTVAHKGSISDIGERDILNTIIKQVGEGISSLVIHAGFTLEMLKELKSANRIMGMVSKGGSFTAAWMLQRGRENPFLSQFDRICEIMAEMDSVLSLGNAMRSGCVHDFMDGPQEMEIAMNASLAKRANELGVQVIIEGMGGHVSPEKIPEYVAHYKKMTDFRPLFVAGPLPTDIGDGYDHISGCPVGAFAAGAEADYLCSITSAEHLALPSRDQVREGVIAFKIGAHIGDVLEYGPRPQDKILAMHRGAKDWESQFRAAIDGDRARQIHAQNGTKTCSVCGKYRAIDIMDSHLR